MQDMTCPEVLPSSVLEACKALGLMTSSFWVEGSLDVELLGSGSWVYGSGLGLCRVQGLSRGSRSSYAYAPMYVDTGYAGHAAYCQKCWLLESVRRLILLQLYRTWV